MSHGPGHESAAAGEPGALVDSPAFFYAGLCIATLIGAALRLHDLGGPSLWVDEFFTIGRAGTDPIDLTRLLGYLPTRVGLWLNGAELSQISLGNIQEWPSLGVTEAAARTGAAWIGILTIPVFAFLARSVVGGGVAASAALLLAISPWHIYWSQMARFYSPQFLFASIYVLALARAVRTDAFAWFGLAAIGGLLAGLCHPTQAFVIGATFGGVLLLVLLHGLTPPLRHALLLVVPLGLVIGPLLLEHGSGVPGTRTTLASQTWGPPLHILAIGAVLRIEPVIFVAGVAAGISALRSRATEGVMFGAVAIFVPAICLALEPVFPIGPRYFFPCLIGWTLLAATWTVNVFRTHAPASGTLAGLAGLGILLVAVGANAYLSSIDGAGQRLRWREAYAFVRAQADPDDRVIAATGKFQASFYFGRPLSTDEPEPSEFANLEPGTWVLHRGRRPLAPVYREFFDVRAHFEIPSKPWGFVVWVLRVPPATTPSTR